LRKSLLPAVLLVLGGCASAPTVDMEEPHRVVGTENNVRIDAQIFGERLSEAVRIPIKYDITNQRQETIAIADLIPEAEYDPDTQTVTVSIGSEVPGIEFLPRLITIPPGEKRSFSAVARVNIAVARTVTPNSRFPNALRLKLNFLGNTSRFEQLIGISERIVRSPELANELFPIWLERNETVFTSVVPMRWSFEPVDPGPAQRRPGRRV
jgi:hypothetical protein